jgi:hypothetical protein
VAGWVRGAVIVVALVVLGGFLLHLVLWALMMAVGVGFLLLAWSQAHRHPFVSAALVVVGVVVLLRWGGFWFWLLPLGLLAAAALAAWELLGRRAAHRG